MQSTDDTLSPVENDRRGRQTAYNPMNRHERRESGNEEINPEGRWRKYSYEQIVARDKTRLDISSGSRTRA